MEKTNKHEKKSMKNILFDEIFQKSKEISKNNNESNTKVLNTLLDFSKKGKENDFKLVKKNCIRN
jgi:uncharacterized Fe-S cluster-containing MiaB family protein